MGWVFMNPVVRQEIDILIRLQETETRAHDLRIILKDVTARQEDLEKELERERLILEEKSGALEKLRKQYKGFEDDLRYNEERLKKSEQTLRAVTNNRDYQVLLREMDDNRKVNGRIQEAMLGLLDQIEGMEKALGEAQARVDAEVARVAQEREELLSSCSRERASLEQIENERRTIGADAPVRLIKLFEQAVRLGNGVGVSYVSGNTCKGCFMTLPPQFCIELQRCNAINRCPRCNRIVYWNDI